MHWSYVFLALSHRYHIGDLEQHCFNRWLVVQSHQSIAWTNTDLLSLRPLWIHYSLIWVNTQGFPCKILHLNILSAKWRPFCSGFNSLRPRQNIRHFADDVFKCNFLNDYVWIPIEISLKFVPKRPINNIPALVQIVAWRHKGDKPLSEPKMTQFNDVYMRHWASMS